MIDSLSSAVKTFNSIQKGRNKPCHFKFGSENMEAFSDLLVLLDVDYIPMKDYVEQLQKYEGDEFKDFCKFLAVNLRDKPQYPQEEESQKEEPSIPETPRAPEIKEEPVPVPETPTPVVVPQPEQVTTINASLQLNILEQAIAEDVIRTRGDYIRSKIAGSLDEEIRKFIFDTYGPIKKKIQLEVDGQKVEMGTEVLHEMFEPILKLTKLNIPCFLTGPAGTGKSVICQQVAKALNLDFYFSNAVTQEYKITGFTDANGVYHETPFYKAFKNGGLFFLDEMDASIPDVLVILNAAIANRKMDFPAPIGNVDAHTDFRVIAAGNTFGTGADAQYVGRFQLDMATLNRFSVVQVGYSPDIEMLMANGNEELLEFSRCFRAAVNKAGIRMVVSYRNIGDTARALKLIPLKEALSMCFLKAMAVDDISMVISSYAGSPNNRFYKALKELKKEA